MGTPTQSLLLIGFALSLSTAACSRQDDAAQNNMTTLETVDPMTNETEPAMGNSIGTTTNTMGADMGGASNTTGSLPTDATTTMTGTNSSGPSDTRGTRGEGVTRSTTQKSETIPPR